MKGNMFFIVRNVQMREMAIIVGDKHLEVSTRKTEDKQQRGSSKIFIFFWERAARARI